MTEEINRKGKISIVLDTNYKLICSFIESDESKQIIQLKEKQEEYIPCISFRNNDIIICDETIDSIHFIKELLDHPEEYKLYSIRYNDKEYQVIGEVLFALIIQEFKFIVEKQFILTETEITLPMDNKKSLQRIKVALEAIGMKGVELTEDDDYDYTHQGEILKEILEKKEMFKPYQRMIEEAINLSDSKKEILSGIKQSIDTEEKFQEEMIKNFSTRERSKMKLYRLDNYCLFIASRYFETLEDHLNFLEVSKRLQFNLEKFHYNPISVDSETMKYFPNMETHHIYENEDNSFLTGGRIKNYCIWGDYEGYEKIKRFVEEKKNEGKNVEFKWMVWNEDDFAVASKKSSEFIEIPNDVKEIDCRLVGVVSLN